MEVNNSLENYVNSREWRIQTVEIFRQIPSGMVVNYGTIARLVNTRFSQNVNARNVAQLRGRIYEFIDHDEHLVRKYNLHRIACLGDYESNADSKETAQQNEYLRSQEGTTDADWWLG